MAGKHIIFIHGRGEGPDLDTKTKLTRRMIEAGLARADQHAARAFSQGSVRCTVAYYGDIVNRIMVEAEPELKDTLALGPDGCWYEGGGAYDDALEALLARPADMHTREEFEKLTRDRRNTRLFRELARLVSPALSLFGIGGAVIAAKFPDLRLYMESRKTAAAIQDRLEGPLRQALLAGDDVALVAHSMGAIVSYDVLWKFSNLSQYRELCGNRLRFWLTLGSPLGDANVRETLIDRGESPGDKYPRNIDAWVNVAATDDFVAHGTEVHSTFRTMLDRGYSRSAIDVEPIYNFYAGREGSNPHKSYGYLAHPTVGALLAAWMMAH